MTPPIFVRLLEGGLIRAEFILQAQTEFTLTPEQRESINDWSDLSLRLLGEGWTFKTDKKNDRIIATHVSGVEQVVISEVFLTYNKP